MVLATCTEMMVAEAEPKKSTRSIEEGSIAGLPAGNAPVKLLGEGKRRGAAC